MLPNLDVETDVALAALGTTQLNASRLDRRPPVARRVDQRVRTPCTPWTVCDTSCTMTRQSPTAVLVSLACLGLPLAMGCGNDDGPSCDSLSQRAYDEATAIRETADRTCSNSSDCTLSGYYLSCFDVCGSPVAVASSALASLEADLGAVERTHCASFWNEGCEVLHPPCVGPGGTASLVCRDSQCALEYGPP